jgi:hypothetical protein
MKMQIHRNRFGMERPFHGYAQATNIFHGYAPDYKSGNAEKSDSVVALRVIGGDEKGTQCLGYNRATLFLGDINTRPDPSGWGSLESET